MGDKALTLYSRHGCHLCEDMQSQLPAYLTETSLELKVVYVDDNASLEQNYGALVPVLKAGEREICHYFLDVKALQRYISEQGNPLN